MKHFFSILLVSVGLANQAWAHDHSLTLQPGQALWGWNWSIRQSNVVEEYFTANRGVVESIRANVSTIEFNTPWAGDVASYEYALTRGWSIGAKANLVQSLVWLLRDKIVDLRVGVFSNWELTPYLGFDASLSQYRLFLYQEVQLSPAYTNSPTFGDGLLNSYATLTQSWTWSESEEGSISTYLDLKAISTFPHPYYRFAWMQKAFFLADMAYFGLVPSENFKIHLMPTARFVASLGFENRFATNVLFYLGLNIPFAELKSDAIGSYDVNFVNPSYDFFDLLRWECELKFRI